jgi:hypothetical protein
MLRFRSFRPRRGFTPIGLPVVIAVRAATLIACCLILPGPFTSPVRGAEPFRPPAVPLVAHDPYFSVWSPDDRLTDGWSRHWTGATHAMAGLARIDGQPYRFLGPQPSGVPAMKQLSVEVLPTRTIYQFEAAGAHLTLTFTTPALPHDLDTLARPVSYLTWDVRAADGREHAVALYFDCSAEWAVNQADQHVTWGRSRAGELSVLQVGSKDQPVLAKAGDNLRIDWGYLYLAVPRQGGGGDFLAEGRAARTGFAARGALPAADDPGMPRAANDRGPVLAWTSDLGRVGVTPASRHLLLAYDDLYSVEYFGRKLRPYWRRHGAGADGLLRAAARDYARLVRECRAFDDEIMADLRRAGGERYARLAALSYRQCLAAHKLVAAADGSPLYLSKENFSNGCVATVDVTYPSSPFFLLFNPALLRAQLVPVLDYARSPRWRHPFAPHDLGTYPKANGQVYGGGENSAQGQMPVEECGNMLILVAALARAEGKADLAVRYGPLLARWADYLRQKGLDPEDQLCTDDFAGRLAHNTNLSVKAVVALGAYAQLCDTVGQQGEGAAYRKVAREMARQWARKADDGDHYRLTFDRPGTWSQKYNLVWDRLLGLGLFPPEVARKEMAYYKQKQGKYGLPLDNRKRYAKLDWTVWTATLAESRADFDAFIGPLYRFAQESPSRVPLTDWYWTHDGKRAGFQARSVVGGVFVKLLADPALAKKWSRRAAAPRSGP